MALAWLVDYRITKPLRSLEFAFARLAKGDFDCHVDERRFKQVMLNLLSNAIKYNKPHGDIFISCSVSSNNQCTISEADTGYGFAADDVSRLFKPFDRLGAETSNINGTGIGLVITRELVERMQGEIRVQSELNKGSCFSLIFNAFKQADVSTKTDILAKTDFTTQSDIADINEQLVSAETFPILEVLVAEDQVTNQLVLKQQLTLLGVHSTFVSNGEQAWQSLQDKRFDILLTDIQMPILDGLGLAKRIRADNRFKDLAIVAITANIIKDNIDACYDAGMNGFLTKPVELAKLKSLLMEHSTTMVNAHIEAKKPSEVASDSFDQLDIALLNAMLGDDPTVHCMVFNAFLQTAGEQVKLINAYAASANYADLSFQAHGLKSSSKSVSALLLADMCQQVETLAAKGSVTAEHVSDLEQCFNEVVIQLTRYCEYYE